ncbi:MAG TPA: ATP cone domain-containing protein [Candidatus Binatia bacterium]|nr:ATP cone domain-containing protein [Candidatus Binatia bacterium]
MLVVKANGDKVQFKPEKIVDTLRRIGAKDDLINHIVQKVMAQTKDGMTTNEVYAIVRKELRSESRCLAHRYNLRTGLLKLGPAGFKFEKYVASILRAYEYKTEIPDNELSGLCVMHEVDVIATSPSRTIMIEAKFRNRFDDTVTLKDAMATWARLIDLREGSKAGKNTPFFDEAWIVTNGRFSDRAHQFGVCKGIVMIGWSQTEQSLARMVDHAALYPITVLENLKQWELEAFSKKNLMLCREISGKKPGPLAASTGIPIDRVKSIVDSCKEIVTMQ